MNDTLLNINILLNRIEYIDELLCMIDPDKKQKFRDSNNIAYKNIKPFMECSYIKKQMKNTYNDIIIH